MTFPRTFLDGFIKAASAVTLTRAPSVNDSAKTRARAPKYTAPQPAPVQTTPELVAPQKSIEPPPC